MRPPDMHPVSVTVAALAPTSSGPFVDHPARAMVQFRICILSSVFVRRLDFGRNKTTARRARASHRSDELPVCGAVSVQEYENSQDVDIEGAPPRPMWFHTVLVCSILYVPPPQTPIGLT